MPARQHEKIDTLTRRVEAFGKDSRAGIERTLHRISAIRNRRAIVGLTCRVVPTATASSTTWSKAAKASAAGSAGCRENDQNVPEGDASSSEGGQAGHRC